VHKYQFAQVRLEAARAGHGKSLRGCFPREARVPEVHVGPATLSNLYKHLARMGLEGRQIVDKEMLPNGDGVDHVFWLHRELA
jgi:hypothetical protein